LHFHFYKLDLISKLLEQVIPEPGQPLTKNKIKSVYEKEQKGAITAIAAVSGFLVAAVGQKVYVFELKNKELYGLAFIDSQIYIHQLVRIFLNHQNLYQGY